MDLKEATIRALRGLYNALPILLGVILLVGLLDALLPKQGFSSLFVGGIAIQTIIAALLGSIFAGNPITSYILGGELLKNGISLIPITAFIVSWVTVGIVQLPAEALMLGKRFAIVRNITAFVLSVIVAILTVIILNLV